MFLFTNGELDRLGAGLALHVAAPVELALAPLLHSGEQGQDHYKDCVNFDGFQINSDNIHSGEQGQHYFEDCDDFDGFHIHSGEQDQHDFDDFDDFDEVHSDNDDEDDTTSSGSRLF